MQPQAKNRANCSVTQQDEIVMIVNRQLWHLTEHIYQKILSKRLIYWWFMKLMMGKTPKDDCVFNFWLLRVCSIFFFSIITANWIFRCSTAPNKQSENVTVWAAFWDFKDQTNAFKKWSGQKSVIKGLWVLVWGRIIQTKSFKIRIYLTALIKCLKELQDWLGWILPTMHFNNLGSFSSFLFFSFLWGFSKAIKTVNKNHSHGA